MFRLCLWFLIMFLCLSQSASQAISLRTDHDGIPVLVYHHLLRDQENRFFRHNTAVITPEMFAEQMQYLYEHGYSTVTLQELEEYRDGKRKLPPKSIVITFDDGYLSNLYYAYPILKRYSFQAAIFLITENIRKEPTAFHPDRLDYISWPELAKYNDVFSFEGHSHHFHRTFWGISYLVLHPKKEIIKDLLISQKLLPSSYFAYPYGQYTPKTIHSIEETGYRMAFTIEPRRIHPGSNKWRLGRYWIGPDMTMQSFKELVKNNKG